MASISDWSFSATSAVTESLAATGPRVMDLYGRLDILVNNAGMSGNFGPGEPLDLALTDRAFFLNLKRDLIHQRDPRNVRLTDSLRLGHPNTRE